MVNVGVRVQVLVPLVLTTSRRGEKTYYYFATENGGSWALVLVVGTPH
jgi:hypothetical protein